MSKETFVIEQDYSNVPLLCGKQYGMFDTINKKHPEIWDLYKQCKSLDWDENEVSYASCLADFERCDKSTYQAMIMTLAFQWEADSVVSRLAPTLSPFITSSELWAAWQRVSDQEVIHAACYSEIIRNSFKNPQEVFDEILKIDKALSRLNVIGKILHDTSVISHKYALGEVTDDEAYNQVFLFIVAVLLLERIQFISSFAVTFAICDTGLFEPIGAMIQKIAQDELETHVALDKAVLKHEMGTKRGRAVFEKNESIILEMIDEVVSYEMEWVDYLFGEGRSIVGLNSDLLKQWVLFNAKDVYSFFKIKSDKFSSLPTRNPLPFMEKWLNISTKQGSPQESDITQYKVNLMARDDDNIVFDDFDI